MNTRKGLAVTILLCSWFPELVAGGTKNQDPLERALYEHFPKAPVTVDSETATKGILLLETAITKGWTVTGAIVERRRDGELIRASRFEKNLILFCDLEPDAYTLRLIKGRDFLGEAITLTLRRDTAPTVDVQAGAVRYLGVVTSHIRTIFNSPAEVVYSAAGELEAWSQFKKRYAGSPWISLVDQRIECVGSEVRPEATATPDEEDPHR